MCSAPGRDSVTIIFGKTYCQHCRDGITAVRNRVGRHVEPKDCFIWYVSNDNWQPITGTGCAHWVSHQMNIHAGTESDCCFSGFTYRVPFHSRADARAEYLPRAGERHLVVTDTGSHGPCHSRYSRVPGRWTPHDHYWHDSSGQGRVAENDFATYFHGGGSFYR